MNSDMYSLGAIFHELVRDESDGRTIYDGRVDGRRECYITRLLGSLNQTNWWNRPPSSAFCELLASLGQRRTEIRIMKNDGSGIQIGSLGPEDKGWRSVTLKQHWYISFTFSSHADNP